MSVRDESDRIDASLTDSPPGLCPRNAHARGSAPPSDPVCQLRRNQCPAELAVVSVNDRPSWPAPLSLSRARSGAPVTP
jgi:hypothetical protein